MNRSWCLGLPAVAGLVFTVSAQGSPALAEPVKVQADGRDIDAVGDIGHAGPLLRDHDGDGLPDLLVSSFRGSIRFFKNTGERTAPRFVEKEPLQAGGAPIRIHNW